MMNIKLLTDWGGAEKGTALVIGEIIGADLIKRGIAEESKSARKGAGKSGGKDK